MDRRKSIIRFYYIFPIAVLLLTPAISSLTVITTDDSSDYTFSELNISHLSIRHSFEYTDHIPKIGLLLSFYTALLLVVGIIVLADILKIFHETLLSYNSVRAPPVSYILVS